MTEPFSSPILLDSDIFIDYLGGAPAAPALVDSATPTGVSISVITYFESLHGLRKLHPVSEANARLHATLIGVPVLPVTTNVAAHCVDIHLAYQESGRSIRTRALDLLIAATALADDLTLVTCNVTDFRPVPNLRLIVL